MVTFFVGNLEGAQGAPERAPPHCATNRRQFGNPALPRRSRWDPRAEGHYDVS